jgi:polyhydroxyalkanoate synthesis regulator phasin
VSTGGSMRTGELDDVLLRLKGLVFVRSILEERGATREEIDEHSAEIERLRERLAELVRKADGAYQTAA